MDRDVGDRAGGSAPGPAAGGTPRDISGQKKRMTMKRINLALQGGGAHGAFTWGVLDRLLQVEDIEIAGISGTSAGALNGAALKAGLATGGREAARENLDWLWGQVGALDETPIIDWMIAASPTPGMMSTALEYSPQYLAADAAMRLFSPYSLGPFYRNPLERIVRRFDFDNVCAKAGPALFICATNVRTGKIKVFSGDEIGDSVIMASACLPTLFQAVHVTDPATGETDAYWDGGYTGNPALFPLFDHALPADIMVININPLERSRLPVSPQEIMNRINEISFNSSLLRELRAIEFVQRLIAEGRMPVGAMKNVLIHMVSDDALMNELSVATKVVPSGVVLAALKDAGQRAADQFLEQHFDDLNVVSSVDLPKMFN